MWMRKNFKPEIGEMFSFIDAKFKSWMIFTQEQTRGVLNSDDGQPIIFYNDDK